MAFTWHGGFSRTTDAWGNSRFSGSTWVEAFTNWVATAASRYPNIEYIIVANEALEVDVSKSGFAQAFVGTGTTGCDLVVNIAKLFRQYVTNRYVVGVTGPWTFRKSDNSGVPGSQSIVDDSASPSSNTGTDSPTMTWLKRYIPGVLE
jgi:hypothetical protein